jgi:hypothetical protein
MKKLIPLIMTLSLLGSLGCATMMRGKTQEVSIDSLPSNAEGFVDGVKIRTPVTVTLSRKGDHHVILNKRGYRRTEATIQKKISLAWLLTDVLLWGPFALIDLGGGVYNLEPNELLVDLQRLGSARPAIDPEKRDPRRVDYLPPSRKPPL